MYKLRVFNIFKLSLFKVSVLKHSVFKLGFFKLSVLRFMTFLVYLVGVVVSINKIVPKN